MDVSPGDGGSVKVNQTGAASYPASYTFASGSSVSLQAVPADGYSFTGWSGAPSSTSNPITILLDCDKSVIANFRLVDSVSQSWFHWSYIPIAAAILLVVGVPTWFIIKNRLA